MLFRSLSRSAKADEFCRVFFVRVLITARGEWLHTRPELSLGRPNLPWARPEYENSPPPVTGRPPAHGSVRHGCTQIPASLLSPTLLSASGLPARAELLAHARRQAKRRQDRNVKAQHAQAEQARRQRAKSLPQPVEKPDLAPPRGHTPRAFFSWSLCNRPGCYQHPANSIRNQARYCSCACRQAVRNALDRERKWRSRGTLDGRKKRSIEYEAAQRRRAFRHAPVANSPPSRPPPD